MLFECSTTYRLWRVLQVVCRISLARPEARRMVVRPRDSVCHLSRCRRQVAVGSQGQGPSFRLRATCGHLEVSRNPCARMIQCQQMFRWWWTHFRHDYLHRYLIKVKSNTFASLSVKPTAHMLGKPSALL
jgi:hypothetical protein